MNHLEHQQEALMMEIRDANLSYLMLAQQMIRTDKVSAIYRLGVSKDIADLLEGLSNAQLIKLASSNMLITRFRFDDKAIISMLTSHTKSLSQTIAHSTILMADQPVENIA